MKPHQITRIIKLYTRQVEELQIQKASLLQKLQQLEKQFEIIEAERDKEKDFLTQNPDHTINHESFFNNIKRLITKIHHSIKGVNNEINSIDQKIIDLYKEQKKYEILQENQQQLEKEKEKLQETKLFDEIAARKQISE